MAAELFAVPFALSLIFLCVIQLTMHAIMCLLFRVPPWKQTAAQNVLVRLVEFVANIGTAATRTIVEAGARLLGLWILFVTVLVIFSAIWVTYEEYPQAWHKLIVFYNSNIGPFLSQWFVIPFQILDLMLRALLPVYNAVIWWGKALLFQGLLPITLREISTILKIASTLLEFTRDLANAFLVFIESFRCVGDSCFVQESRAFDMLSALGQVRMIVALGRELVGAFCSALAAPIDALIFPLLDLNFALGIHNIWNSVVQLFLVVPHATFQRCALSKHDTFGVMMCIPDVEPVFHYLTAGIADIGRTVDNWVNVLLLIIQNLLTNSSPSCETSVARITPSLFLGASSIFGNNFTAIVGLTQWMYAATDGYTAIYKGSDDTSVRTQLWPYAMDPSLGVAAVTYGALTDLDGTTMTGVHRNPFC